MSRADSGPALENPACQGYAGYMFKGFYLGPLFLTPFDLLLTFILLALLIPLGHLYGKRLANRGLDLDTAFATGPRAWIVLLGFLGICVIMGVVYRFPYLLTPAQLSVLEPGSWLAAKSGAVFLAAMALPLGGAQRQKVLTAAGLGAFCVLAVLGLQGWFLRPISPSEIRVRQARDGSILQSTSVTCSAAAFANALRLFGIEASERESARLLGTRDSGTSQGQLLNGASHYGLFAYYVSVRPEHLVRMNQPAIVSIKLGMILHSILIYGHDAKGNLLTLDPMSGKGKHSPARLLDQLSVQEGVVLTDQPVPQVEPDAPGYLITRAQQILKREGYLTSISHTYDADMISAVEAFQQRWNLPINGRRINAQTWLLLTGPEAPQRSFPRLAHQSS